MQMGDVGFRRNVFTGRLELIMPVQNINSHIMYKLQIEVDGKEYIQKNSLTYFKTMLLETIQNGVDFHRNGSILEDYKYLKLRG